MLNFLLTRLILSLCLIAALLSATTATFAATGACTKSLEKLLSRQIKEIARVNGLHGGQRLLVIRRGQQGWKPFFNNGRNNPGSPLVGSILLKKNSQEYFGYKKIEVDGNEAAMIPDTTESNKSFDHFNNLLPKDSDQKIALRFYSADGTTSVREYLLRFIEMSELPAASRGFLTLHDIDFHVVSAFLLDEKWIQAAKDKAVALLAFEFWLKERAPDFAKKKETKEAFKIALNKRTYEIDLSGNIVPAAERESARHAGPPAITALMGGFISPNEYLQKVFFEEQFSYFPENKALGEKIKAAGIADELTMFLNSFQAEHPEFNTVPEKPKAVTSFVSYFRSRLKFIEDTVASSVGTEAQTAH